MLSKQQINELRDQAKIALSRPVIRFVELDPRTLLELIDEVSDNTKFISTATETTVIVDPFGEFKKPIAPLVGVPVVFWRCPDHPTGTVKWDHHFPDVARGTISVATCQQCGRMSNEADARCIREAVTP